MKSGAGTVMTFRVFALRDVLLFVQIALCTLLVTASLVAVRGMQRSLHAPLGVEPMAWRWQHGDLDMANYSAVSRCWQTQKRMIGAVGKDSWCDGGGHVQLPLHHRSGWR